jgi:capsular polysaccharide transport system permease protein
VRAGTLARALAVAWPPTPAAGHPTSLPVGAVGAVGAAMPAPPERQDAPGGLPRLRLVPALGPAGQAAAGPARPSLRSLSFVALVLLPVAVTAAYYFAVAADQYVAEFRFALNTVDPPRLDPLALFSGNAAHSPAALEAQVLVQYITSRAIVDEIGATIDVRRLFAPPEADWWARLPRSASIEELVRYWKGQVDPSYDSANGTVTVRLRAFAPEDALRLSQAVVAACEKLVNDLSLRARRDTLRHAEAELAQSENRLKAALGEIRAFRDREGLIDPVRSAEATGVLDTRVRDDLVRANAELSTLKAYMRDDAPSIKVLKARIRSLEAQRRSLAREMTDPAHSRSDTLSRVLGSYEQLESERKFAEAAYQHGLHSLDRTRASADRQHVFIASFIPPSLPEEALYPRRWRVLGTVALMALALWGIGGLTVQSIRDHLR